ncbi:putative serine carboxypeptidase CPVL [Amblyomma americanum]
MNVIYLDLPVGAGYSFADSPASYPQSLEKIALEAREFLRQFLLLFPGFKNRDFYTAGESYAARYAVGIAHSLLATPSKNVPLRLRGVIGGSPFVGPVFDVADSSEFLYRTAMLTHDGRRSYSEYFKEMRRLKDEGNVDKALLLLRHTIFPSREDPSLFEKLTSFECHASALYSDVPGQMRKYKEYVQQYDFRESIHVSQEADFEGGAAALFFSLSTDMVRDISGLIELLLNRSRVLLYTGSMDTLLPSTKLREYFRTLQWTHAAQYRRAPQVPWKPYEGCRGMCGYTIKLHNFTEAVLLGAGHYTSLDKQDEMYFLLNEFIQGG